VAAAVEAAAAVLRRFDESGPRDGMTPTQFAYSLAEAELRRAQGDHLPEHWIELAGELREARHPYEAAYAEYRAAEAIVRSGGPAEDAERLLGAAADTAVRLGAQPLLAELTALARRARLAPNGAGIPAARVAVDDDDLGLTDREREVLLLLAEGRTNRQIGEELFISEKTASVHVSRILAKLGVANRAEAAGIAHTLGLQPAGAEPPHGPAPA
jgi:DNA-binding NarL/FixJ family response regulator